MFIAKVTLDFTFSGSREFTVSKTGRPLYWTVRFKAQTFPTRQKARIAAKEIFRGRDKKIQIYEITPELEAELIIEKLRNY